MATFWIQLFVIQMMSAVFSLLVAELVKSILNIICIYTNHQLSTERRQFDNQYI